MNKRTRNLAVAASFAAAAVAFDRIGGTPESASAASPAAAPTPAAPVPAAPPGVRPATAPGPASPAGRLDLRLLRDGAGPTRLLPDGNAPFDPFQSAPAEADPTEEERWAAIEPFNVRSFLREHPLEAVLGAGGEARAVVAGRVIRVGASVDGMRLESLAGRYAVWSGRGLRFRAGLRAADPPRPSPLAGTSPLFLP